LLALTHLFDDWEIFFDTTTSVENVYQKVKMAEQNAPYDFIVMGLSYQQMEKNHFDHIYQQVRKLTKTHLVCLINSADADVMSQFTALGVNAVLAKPIKAHELHHNLRSLLIPNSAIYDYQRLTESVACQNESTRKKQLEEDVKTSSKLGGMNILVAEDNEINAKLVKSILSQQGANVIVAGNGNEAVAACLAQRFDIVLMDIHMPETNGVEATKQIRANQTTEKPIPIVALTADALSEDQLAFIEAGMNDVLIKPVNEELLINKILYLTNKEPTNAVAEQLAPLSSAPPESAKTRHTTEVTKNSKPSKDSKLADEIMRLLVKELPAFKQSIKQSHDQKNLDSLYQHVHKLHGAISYCDLPKIKSMIQKIERDLKANRHETLDLDLDALFRELDELIQNVEH
jgi:two-component system sensor histidine kinase BarA